MKAKKGVLLFLTLIVLTITLASLAIAQEPETEIDKAYSCLEENLADNCGNTRSTKQAAFNLLASSYSSSLQSDCKDSLIDKIKDDCWGETDTGSCNIKSTALATLALENVQTSVDDYTDYLLSKRIKNTGLTWYLQIDSNNKTTCDINGKEIILEDNKKISGSPPPGLIKSYDNYWFEVKDLEKNYTISCNNDFITALLYQKPNSNTFHVSSNTNSASEFDEIVEKVDSYCFSTSNKCDYEGSLWASLTLAKLGEDTSQYLPYIISMSQETENKQFLPSAFLYILTSSDDYYNELVSLQKSNNYWDESRNKFYDTALALLALSDVSSDEAERAKRYLLSNQRSDGCWQSDTSFLLHAGWPKNTASSPGVSISNCEDFGHYCVSIGNCDLEESLDNFYCPSSSEVCCEVENIAPTCSEKSGIICSLDQFCNGDEVPSSDSSSCCIGDCLDLDVEPECEQEGYICKSSCTDNEEEKTTYSNSCEFGDVCCAKLPQTSGGFNIWLIILLIILIILIILAIVFRNQLKVWYFKRKSGYKSKKTGKPPTNPSQGLMPMPIGRPFLQPSISPNRKPTRRRPSSIDKEFDDTMKKLRDMSK